MNGLNMKRIFFALTLSLIFSSNSFSESSEVLIIDVRTISEWNTGYLKEAKHLPLNQIEHKITNKSKVILVFFKFPKLFISI